MSTKTKNLGLVKPDPEDIVDIRELNNNADIIDSKMKDFQDKFGSIAVVETAAEMKDTDKVYVYAGNESGYKTDYWYYYKDGSWKEGRPFNSNGIKTDKSLEEEGVAADAAATGAAVNELKESLTSKLIHMKSRNLIDLSKVVQGYREEYNAKLVKNDAYDYIRLDVEPSTTYTISEKTIGNINIYQLDENEKGVLPAINIGYNDKYQTFTTEKNTKQLSINFEKTSIKSIQLEKGENVTDYEQFYDFYRSQDVENLANPKTYGTLFKNLLTKKSSKNLINPDEILKGKRFNGDGTTYDQESYDSLKISIEPNETYTLSNDQSNNGNMFITGKDNDGKTTFTTNRTYPNDFATFTTTNDTEYLLISFDANQTKTIQLEKGEKKTSYEEFYEYYILPTAISDELSLELKNKNNLEKNTEIYATNFEEKEEELIKKVQNAIDKDSIVFTLVTDVHGTNKNNGYIVTDGYKFNNNFGYKNFKKFARITSKLALNTSSDFIVNLGDTINSTSDEAYLESNSEVPEVNKEEIKHRYAEFTRFICYDSVPYFTCNAHHEMFPLENENHLSKSEIVGIAGRKNKYIEKIYDDESDENYYFFDIRNVRFIVLDSVCDNQPGIGRSYSAEELSWLKNIALNTEHNVIIFSHVATRDNLGTNIYSGGDELAKILNDFHTESHKILAFYHGHTHFDNIVLPNESGDKFPYISTEKSWCTTYTPDTSGVLGTPTTYERNYNTYEEYCADVNVLDAKTGKIKIFRFGAGSDREVN